MLPMVLVISGEDASECDLVSWSPACADVDSDPLRECDLGGCKIISAERCSASLSAVGIEPGSAPHSAVRPSAKPIVANLSSVGLLLLVSSHGCTSRSKT